MRKISRVKLERQCEALPLRKMAILRKSRKQNEELSLGEKALIDQRNDYDKLTKEIAEKQDQRRRSARYAYGDPRASPFRIR